MANIISQALSKPQKSEYDPNYLAKLQEAQRRQALAQSLQQEGMSDIQYDRRGEISPAQAIAKVLNTFVGSKINKSATDEMALIQAQQKAAKDKADMDAFGIGGSVRGSLSISDNGQNDYEIYKRDPEGYLKALTESRTPTSDMKNYVQSGAGSEAYKQKLLAELIKSQGDAARSQLMDVSGGNTIRNVLTNATWTAPKIDTVDTGGSILTNIIDANNNTVNPISAVNKTMSPSEQSALNSVDYQTDIDGNILAVPTKLAPGKAPIGVPVTNGQGAPIKGKAQPLTESQGNAALFGARAQEADQIINNIGNDYNVTGLNAKKAVDGIPGISSIANSMLSDKSQQVEQAQRDFLNAVLRKESGASIGASEFANADKQYFPHTGDSPAVIAQKAENRRTAIAGLNVMAGPGAKLIQKEVAKKDAVKKEGGELHVDANGNKAIVYPDGSYEEVQ